MIKQMGVGLVELGRLSGSECVFCGKTGTNKLDIDCDDYPHDAHSHCLKLFASWMRVGGSNEKPGDRKKADEYNKLADF